MAFVSKPNPSLVPSSRRWFAALCLSLGSASGALAAECYPHCDYVHNYGPYDFTYVRPGLYGYPLCNVRGECAPNLVYSTSGRPRRGNIEARFISRPRLRRQ
jgi:hypothetical protein